MKPYLESAYNATLDRTPQEWIVGIVIALFLALALAGINMACRRWIKAKDDTVPIVGVGIVAIFAGMFIAGTYVELNHRGISGRASAPADAPGMMMGGGPMGGPGGGMRGPGGGRTSTRMATLIFEGADADHDGLLTVDEAANAAAKFVHESDPNGKGKLDQEALVNLIRQRMGPPGGGGGGAPPPASGGAPPAPSSPPVTTGGTPEATPPATPPTS